MEEYLDQGKDGVFDTIAEKRWATPQVAGTKILIGDYGKIFGTEGGGCGKTEVWQEARKTLKTKEAVIVHYALNSNEVENDGMICVGNIDVFLEPFFKKYRDLDRNISHFQKKWKKAVNTTHFEDGYSAKTI